MTARAYRFFVVVLLLALTVPRMTQRGMFGDGLNYAVISRNLSLGIGSVWSPVFSITTAPFFEHPPAGFALQAVAFRLFGEHPAVERVYSVAAFALTALLTVAIWRRVQPRDEDWLPLFFWVLPSIVTWTVINNMLENTQTVFTTAAVWLLMIAAAAASPVAAMAWSALTGVAIVIAVLTKGPVGFFPLAVPAILAVTLRDMPARRVVLTTASMLVVVGLIGAALFSFPPSRHALLEYLHTQLIPSLEGKREVNGDPLSAVRHLGLGIVARMAVIAALSWVIARRRARLADVSWRIVACFVAVAVASSVPIAISPKLVGHYFLPSVPFYALAAAAVARPAVAAFTRGSGVWTRLVPVAIAAALILASAFLIVTRGSIERRDVELIEDLDAIQGPLPRDAVIGACEASAADWRLQGYLSRFYRISVDATGRPANGWLLQVDRACVPAPPCVPAAAAEHLVLFRCER